MKKIIVIASLGILLFSCNEKTKIEQKVKEIPVKINVTRFEQSFFECKPNDLPKLKEKFPEFFPIQTPDAVWLDKIKNPLWQELYQEVEKNYKDFTPQQDEIVSIFKHIKYYFPTVKTPNIYTVIGDMDYMNKTIYAKDKLIIALEMYLGKDHKFYADIPQYIKNNFEKRQMMPDVVSSFAFGVVPPASDKTLLAQMITSGKELYLKDLLLPEYNDAEKIGYQPEQIKWCEENQGYIWEYFIQNKLLYSNDSKLTNRFITLAPFSKFYLEIDNETPGRIGQWIGWQIVRAFVQNNPDISATQLLKTDYKTIFEKSKYKPKKDE